MRDDSLDALVAITGVSSFLSGAICSADLGVYKLPSGCIFVDPEALLGLSGAVLADRLMIAFAEAGRRLSGAARRRPSRASSSIVYDNIIYALALSDTAESTMPLSGRVMRLAGAVSKARGGTTSPAEVIPLILAAALVADTLYFAPPSSSSSVPAYKAVVEAFALASTPGLRPLRGVPPGTDTAAVRALLREAYRPKGAAPPVVYPSGANGAGSPPVNPSDEYCKQWARNGKCTFGSSCKYPHPPRGNQDENKGSGKAQ